MLILWGLKDWAAMQQGGTPQKELRCAGWTGSQNSSCLCREEDSSFACLWRTLQDRNALVCNLQNKPQSGFLLKGSFILGLEENRKEKKESMKSRAKQGYGGSVLFCRSASPHSCALAFCCPLLVLCLSSWRSWGHVPTVCQQGQAGREDLLLPQHRQSSQISRWKDPVPGFAGIALIPAKTGLKRTHSWDDLWQHHQPKESVSSRIPVNLKGKVAHGRTPSYMFRTNIQAAAPSWLWKSSP